ncbi:DUF4871 domain-containing protein [Salinibacillus xinjiangensis]|uniref:DUF4871 domain-containing protein n=1 Tax=Salinibacillus xinjiangensis TaxID=1229268 RepID=A0A6G1XBF9_9BACI|nr:DUF4871 domain-containing protein [Salinibacillus xinjiangensis]MRG88324.1 DUF4871 domain-containing protein [Salinibacillus xinjiangensis]
MRENEQYKEIIDELDSLPEPNYEKEFDSQTQSRIHENLMKASERIKSKQKRGAFMNRVSAGLFGVAALLIFSFVVWTITNDDHTALSPDQQSDENINTIKTVLENTLTGPDEQLKDIWKAIENGEDVSERVGITLEEYSEEKFKQYFTEDMFQDYISTYAYSYLRPAYWNDFELKVMHIDVKPSSVKNNIYDFSIEIQYQQESSESETVFIKGQANVNEDGKIEEIIITGNGLLETLKEWNNYDIPKVSWKPSPIFEHTVTDKEGDKHIYSIIGKEGKIGFTNTELVASEPKKHMWFYWGEDNVYRKSVEVIGLKKGTDDLIKLHTGTFDKGAQVSENSVNMPSNMDFPSAGVWNILVYINREFSESIVVEVK